MVIEPSKCKKSIKESLSVFGGGVLNECFDNRCMELIDAGDTIFSRFQDWVFDEFRLRLRMEQLERE